MIQQRATISVQSRAWLQLPLPLSLRLNHLNGWQHSRQLQQLTHTQPTRLRVRTTLFQSPTRFATTNSHTRSPSHDQIPNGGAASSVSFIPSKHRSSSSYFILILGGTATVTLALFLYSNELHAASLVDADDDVGVSAADIDGPPRRVPPRPPSTKAPYKELPPVAEGAKPLDHDDALQWNEESGEVEWTSNSKRPRIVVLGTGWGAATFLKHLEIGHYELVVVSPTNYFLFTPLLPSACTGTIEIGSLVEPIRQILLSRHKTKQSQYVEAKAIALDRDKRKVKCVDSNGRTFFIEYDHLLCAVGANNNTFGTPGVKEHAFFLKEAKHARIIRRNILDLFERASSPTTTKEEKELLLSFVVVGGGPTGVEVAGELVDFIRTDATAQFPQLQPLISVKMVQSQEHILNTYDQRISEYAERKFKQLNIDLITNARVKGITADALTYMDKTTKEMHTMPFGLCVWSTGIEKTPFTRHVAESVIGQDSSKALVTDSQLRLLQEIPAVDRQLAKEIVKEATDLIKPPTATSTSPSQSTSTSTSQTTSQSSSSSAAAAAAASHAPHSVATPTPSSGSPDSGPGLNVDSRVYAIGDCATTYVPKLGRRVRKIFEAADLDDDGKLSYEELRSLCDVLATHFPVISSQLAMLKRQHPEYEGKKEGIDIQTFEKMLSAADRRVRAYPATAQVASQQGKYLAKRFNAYAREQIRLGRMRDYAGRDHLHHTAITVPTSAVQPRQVHPPVAFETQSDKPFRYRHLGSLAYIGGETAGIDLGRGGAYAGATSFWLWKSIYLSTAVSTRTRMNLAYDWFRTWLFGRDTSKP